MNVMFQMNNQCAADPCGPAKAGGNLSVPVK